MHRPDVRHQVRYSHRAHSCDRWGDRQAGAIASLEDEAHFQQARSAVMRNRADLTSALIRLEFDVLPSSANFVFVRHPGHSGQALAAALKERAVLVRHFAAPRISDFLRITIGSESDLRRLTEALSEILAETC
jgi:histidinol-phosphate aminotransferase